MPTFKERLSQLASAGVFDEAKDDGLKLTPVQTAYTVKLGQEAHDAIMRAERLVKPSARMQPSLTDRLEQIAGVENVEYDGGFGPSIFLSISAYVDPGKTHHLVLGVIADQLRRARDLIGEP